MTRKLPARLGEGLDYTDPGMDEPSRYANARCKDVDPEVFFPVENKGNSKSENTEVKFAKKICAECEHETECAAWAILRPYVVGIWGGTTGYDRRRIRKEYKIKGFEEPTYDTGGED